MGQRKTYLIDKRLQLKYTTAFLIVSFIGNIVSITLFYLLALREINSVIWTSHINIDSTGVIFMPLFISINIAVIIFMTLVISAICIWMIKRASGPLIRISRDLEHIANGNLRLDIRLREGDEFHDLAEDINKMRETLRNRFITIKSEIDSFGEYISTIRKKETLIPSHINTLKEHISKIGSELDQFKTD